MIRNIPPHPSVKHWWYISDILRTPTNVTFKDEKIAHFYKYYKERDQYVLIIVKHLNGEGFIITVYLVKRIQ